LEQERLSKAGKILNKQDVIKLFEHHRGQWDKLQMSTALKWDDFPWPVFKHPSGPDDVTTPTICLPYEILYESSCSPQDLRTQLSSQDMRYGHDSAEVGYYGYLDLFIRISRMMPIGGSTMSAEIGRGRRKPSRRRSSSGAWKRKKNARRTRSGAKKKKLGADKKRPSERKKGGGGKKEGGKRRSGRKRRRPGNGRKTSDDRSRQSS
jgi:hypothetical protein